MDGHRLAFALRHAAEHAPPSPSLVWAEGFCDGLRFAAEITDLAADDRLSPENIAEVLAAMNDTRPIRVKDTSKWPPREKP